MIAADHTREIHFAPALKRRVAAIPAALAAALVLFVAGYWGSHIALYGTAGRTDAPALTTTHTHDPQRPHLEPEPKGRPVSRSADADRRLTGTDDGR